MPLGACDVAILARRTSPKARVQDPDEPQQIIQIRRADAGFVHDGIQICSFLLETPGLNLRSASVIDTQHFYFGLVLCCIDADICK